MNFKVGENVICVREMHYHPEEGRVEVGEIYEVEELYDDGIVIKRDNKQNIQRYNWFPEHFFRSAEPELFHNSLEKLSE